MCVKNQRGVLTHRSASPTMPTGTAPVNPDVLHAWAGRHDPDGGEWCARGALVAAAPATSRRNLSA